MYPYDRRHSMLFLPGLPFKIGSSQRAKHLLTSNKHFLKTKNQAERIVFYFVIIYPLLYTAFVQLFTIFIFHRNIIVHIIFVSSRCRPVLQSVITKKAFVHLNNSCIFKRIFNSFVIVFLYNNTLTSWDQSFSFLFWRA